MIELFTEIKNEILRKFKDIELIFISGSYAMGTFQRYSDIDFEVITKAKPEKDLIFKFVKYGNRDYLVTIYFRSMSQVLDVEVKNPNEWVWSYESYKRALVLFDRDNNFKKILDAHEKHYVTPETFIKELPYYGYELVEYVCKLKNAYLNQDELNVLYAARIIAKKCYFLLRVLNPVWRYTTERETYRSYIELKNRPEHYVDDFKICCGITMKERTLEMVFKSGLRIARETVEFLKENKIEEKIKDQEFLKFFSDPRYMKFLEPL